MITGISGDHEIDLESGLIGTGIPRDQGAVIAGHGIKKVHHKLVFVGGIIDDLGPPSRTDIQGIFYPIIPDVAKLRNSPPNWPLPPVVITDWKTAGPPSNCGILLAEFRGQDPIFQIPRQRGRDTGPIAPHSDTNGRTRNGLVQ